MEEGAFALIDCLGFKGIWKRTDPEVLIGKLLRIERRIKRQMKKEESSFSMLAFPSANLQIRLLSDTVAVSLQYPFSKSFRCNKREHKAFVFGICCRAVQNILELFIREEPPLIMRGCVTFGEHVCKGSFLAGPAVDEAAEHLNIAEGAFVWLHPSASDLYSESLDLHQKRINSMFRNPKAKLLLSPHMKKTLRMAMKAPIAVEGYNMPIKNGRYIEATVINPFVFTEHPRWDETIRAYDNVMQSKSVDVWVKRKNTLEFLDVAFEVTEEFLREYAAAGKDSKLDRLKLSSSMEQLSG